MELSVGKRWGQPPRDLGASREGAQSGLRTCSELESERNKKQRSERSERYKKAVRSAARHRVAQRGMDKILSIVGAELYTGIAT